MTVVRRYFTRQLGSEAHDNNVHFAQEEPTVYAHQGLDERDIPFDETDPSYDPVETDQTMLAVDGWFLAAVDPTNDPLSGGNSREFIYRPFSGNQSFTIEVVAVLNGTYRLYWFNPEGNIDAGTLQYTLDIVVAGAVDADGEAQQIQTAIDTDPDFSSLFSTSILNNVITVTRQSASFGVIDAPVNPLGNLVFAGQTSYPTQTNIFHELDVLQDVINTDNSPVTIIFDTVFSAISIDSTINLPAGSRIHAAIAGETVLTLEEGAVFTGLQTISGLRIVTTATTTPPIQVDDGESLFIINNANIESDANEPVIDTTGSVFVAFLNSSTNFEASTGNESFHVGSGTCIMLLSGVSSLGQNSLDVNGSANLSVLYSADTSLGTQDNPGGGSVLFTRSAQAENIGIDTTNLNITADSVQEVFDEMTRQRNRFVYQPGGTAGGNVYTSEVEFVQSVNLANGPVDLYFDWTNDSGSDNFTSSLVLERGSRIFGMNDTEKSVLFSEGAEFKGVTEFFNLQLRCDNSSTPIFEIIDTEDIVLNNCIFDANGIATIFEINAPSDGARIKLINSGFSFGTNTAVNVTNSDLFIQGVAASFLPSGFLDGDGTSNISIDNDSSSTVLEAAGSLPGGGTLTINLISSASRVSVDDSSLPYTADNVQEALEANDSSQLGVTFPDSSTQYKAVNPDVSKGNLSTATPCGSLATPGNTSGVYMDFNGEYFLAVDNTNDDLNLYTLSTPKDIRTGTLSSTLGPLGLSSKEACWMNPDGDRVYVMTESDGWYQYDLSTPYDLTTAGAGTQYDPGTNFLRDFYIRPDGRKVFSTQQSAIFQYDLPTAWDFNGITQDGGSLNISTITTTCQAVEFTSDGKFLYLVDNANAEIVKFRLNIPWDISDINNLVELERLPTNNGVNKSLFILQTQDYMILAAQNQGSLSFTLGVEISGKSISGTIETDNVNIISGGLVFEDGSTQGQAAIENTFLGNLDTQIVGPSFTPPTNARGVFITNYGNYMLITNITQNDVELYDLTTPKDISTGVFNSSIDTTPTGLGFIESAWLNPHGDKVFVLTQNNGMLQYELSTPYDLSTADSGTNYTGTLSLQRDMYIRPDGKILYIIRENPDTLASYSLPEAWNMNGVSLIEQIDIQAVVTSSLGVSFSPDGKFIYIADQGPQQIKQFRLPSPWNISDPTEWQSITNYSTGLTSNQDVSILPTLDLIIQAGNDTVVSNRLGTDTPGLVYSRDRQLIPAGMNILIISEASDLDSKAVSGTYTLTSATTIIFTDDFTSSTNIALNGQTLHIWSEMQPNLEWFYTGGPSKALFDGQGSVRIRTSVRLDGSGTGKLMNMRDGSFNIVLSQLYNWQDPGTLLSGSAFLRFCTFRNLQGAFELIDSGLICQALTLRGTTVQQTLFDIKGADEEVEAIITQLRGDDFSPGIEPILISPEIQPGSGLNIYSNLVDADALFNTDGTTESFISVSNQSIGSTVINSVTAGTVDSFGTRARFNFALGPTVYNHQIVDVTGMSDPDYNVKKTIALTDNTTWFELLNVYFAANDSGNFTSDSIQLEITGTTLVDGDAIQVNQDDSTDYDVGSVVYNVGVNTVDINAVYQGVTGTGTVFIGGIDQRDARVLANENPGYASSAVIAYGGVNANATVTTVTDGAYGVVNFTGFVSSPITERLKLIDATNGIWELTGNEPVTGDLDLRVWTVKSGSNQNYRLALSINDAVPVFASAPYAPMEVQTVKTTSTAIFPFTDLMPGDTLQIKVAGDGTGQSLTFTDVQMEIKA